MDRDSIIAIFVAVIGSNALWGFIQFLLQRKDNKEDSSNKIIEMIKKLDEKIDKLDGELSERSAISCRVRILKFMDEILEGWKHSHDSYVQVMQDITNYLNYCREHPEFKNHQTEASIKYIKNDYQERLEKNNFKVSN
jgi:hypothetical protein